MTTKEKINAFEKAKNYFAPKKWWQFLKKEKYDWIGFCYYFADKKISKKYFFPYVKKYSTISIENPSIHAGMLYNNSSERYEACIKILKELKEELKLEQLKKQ